jgi:integrase/recombinase XerD
MAKPRTEFVGQPRTALVGQPRAGLVGKVPPAKPASPVIGPLGDPGSLYHEMRRFLEWRLEKNHSIHTITLHEKYLRYFVLWCDERGLTRPQEITRPVLERYQRHLFLYRKAGGQPLAASSQGMRVGAIRAWFKWLVRSRRILSNPASDLDLPRKGQSLPKHILTAEEAERVLAMPDLGTEAGVRDRTMMELLYSTGMRRLELARLQVFDVDHDRGTVMIRQGKGKKDRVVPVGDRALAWVARYRDKVRPGLAGPLDDGTLFLNRYGEGLHPEWLTRMVREYVEASGIGKRGSCHLFRHTCATLMLEGGAEVRFIQAMLGHARLDTTQIYTQVSIRKLKDIHTATHPARLVRQASAAAEADPEAAALLADLADEPGSDA